ncbi:hypothetical protein B0H11DRAFT_2221389 [Mycena galericulata]|nr:hypothetical protein B0H11DRAFT_2221389 [Mycena galericulata]
MAQVTRALQDAIVEEWGKVCRIDDSDEGHPMRSCSLGTIADDSRDATYVRAMLCPRHYSFGFPALFALDYGPYTTL